MIRIATKQDVNSILNIYGQYINTPITFEYELLTVSEFSARMAGIQETYPYLVYEENHQILGYAYAHRTMARKAYDFNAELSVYIDKTAVSHGIESKLYRVLIKLLKRQNIQTVCALVTLPNKKSKGLHQKLGFQKVGLLSKSGYKNGVWHDVGWFEKEIGSHPVSPKDVISFDKLPKKEIETILKD